MGEGAAPVRNGWTLLATEEFNRQLASLAADVEELQAADPNSWQQHPKAKFLARVVDILLNEAPADPAHKAFRQGATLGDSYKHWFRVKFLSRFRLFFRWDAKAKVIIYCWLNDESTLRKAGSKTDPYAVFAKRLRSGDPPDNWLDLVKSAASLTLPSDGDR
jgi:toxin YhaV